jgi:hypothetical protein
MKLRTSHLVCLILLLSALRGAEGSVLPAGEYAFDGRYGLVLSQDSAGVWTQVAPGDHTTRWGSGSGFILPAQLIGSFGHALQLGLPSASLATYRTAWTMRPPAAQCVDLHSVTGSGI